MKNSLFLALLCLLLFNRVAAAEPDKDAQFSGLSCVYDQIIKLGKSIVAPGAEKSPPDQTTSPQTSVPATDATDDKPPAATDVTSSGGTAQPKDTDNVDAGAKLTKPKRRTADRSRALTNVHDQSKRAAKLDFNRAKSHEARRGNSEIVSIAASEPELGRMLALASAVSDPTIKIVRQGHCETKPADFTVGTLQDITRLGPTIPLFSESLIIISRTGSTNIKSLSGRNVSFGPAGSSSQQIALRLFSAYKVDVHDTPLDLDNAIDALALGELDAVALLAPAGFKRFALHDPELRLITLGDHAVPPEGLRITTIDPSGYLGGKWANNKVEVVTVDAVLSPNQNPPRDASALSVYAALDRNAPTLAKTGFDLIGGDTLVTMRSVAEDPKSRPSQIGAPAYPAFAQDGC